MCACDRGGERRSVGLTSGRGQRDTTDKTGPKSVSTLLIIMPITCFHRYICLRFDRLAHFAGIKFC